MQINDGGSMDTARNRHGTIDFWRGFVLVAILVNHIPGNPLERFTHRDYGFSDSAEAFVFLSGVSVALAYGHKADAAARCLSRALGLYRTHLLLSLAGLGVFLLGWLVTGMPELLEAHGRGAFVAQPVTALLGLLALDYQIGYFNILPTYVALMLMAPLFLTLLRRHPLLPLVPALALYAVTRLTGLTAPSTVSALVGADWYGWFLNPFAWQLAFALGLSAGAMFRDGIPDMPVVTAVAFGVVALCLVIRLDGLFPEWSHAAVHMMDLPKHDLGLARLGHFLALAWLVATIRPARIVENTAVGRTLQQLGRHGLLAFSVGSVAAAIGQVGLMVAEADEALDVTRTGFVLAVAGVAAMVMVVNIATRPRARTAVA
jgi:hypothetical protein